MARGLLLAATMAFVPSAAHAADRLGLSADGATWSRTLSAPLFDSSFRWIPGDREESSFWVRNQSTDGAILDIAVLGTALDSLMQTGDLAVEVRAGSGPWRSTSQVGRQTLVSSMAVAPRQQMKVTVAVAFNPQSTNESETKAVDLRFDVRLTQALPSDSGRESADHRKRGDEDVDDSYAVLPGTGGLPWWVLPSGAVLTGGGAALVSRARRSRSHA